VLPNFPMYETQKTQYQVKVAQFGVAALLPTDVLTVVSSDLAMATVVPDATAVAGSVASGFVLAGKKPGTVRITVTLTRADKTSKTIYADLDILSSAPVGLTIVFAPPVSQ
jgi:hypothetical protein